MDILSETLYKYQCAWVVAGIYFLFVIVLCVLSATSTSLVMYLHIRAYSVHIVSMAPRVSRYSNNEID